MVHAQRGYEGSSSPHSLAMEVNRGGETPRVVFWLVFSEGQARSSNMWRMPRIVPNVTRKLRASNEDLERPNFLNKSSRSRCQPKIFHCLVEPDALLFFFNVVVGLLGWKLSSNLKGENWKENEILLPRWESKNRDYNDLRVFSFVQCERARAVLDFW